MASRDSTLCLCGCQELCGPGSQWRPGHSTRARALRPLEERFWAKVQKTATCWLWTGAKKEWGYGVINSQRNGPLLRAHRYAYELHYGPIPDGLWCLHRCDVPRCVRPDHLFLGTSKDNTQDMMQKGRHLAQSHPEEFFSRCSTGQRTRWRDHPESIRRGDHHPTAKVTAEQVRVIRQRHQSGDISIAALAREFGVSESAIRFIIQRKTWRHIV